MKAGLTKVAERKLNTELSVFDKAWSGGQKGMAEAASFG